MTSHTFTFATIWLPLCLWSMTRWVRRPPAILALPKYVFYAHFPIVKAKKVLNVTASFQCIVVGGYRCRLLSLNDNRRVGRAIRKYIVHHFEYLESRSWLHALIGTPFVQQCAYFFIGLWSLCSFNWPFKNCCIHHTEMEYFKYNYFRYYPKCMYFLVRTWVRRLLHEQIIKQIKPPLYSPNLSTKFNKNKQAHAIIKYLQTHTKYHQNRTQVQNNIEEVFRSEVAWF